MSTNSSFQQFKDKVVSGDISDWDTVGKNLQSFNNILHNKIEADPENAGDGLVCLVLTLVDIIRKLMERQALRRVEAGSLTEDEIENLGLTLMKLEEKMNELKEHFGLTDDDLNLNLGPLGQFE